MRVSTHEFFILFLVQLCLKKQLLKLKDMQVKEPVEHDPSVKKTSNFVSSGAP
jgi:hypothetical protein